LNSSGAALSGTSGWGGSFLQFPVALAVDSHHNAWVANQSGRLPVTKISADGSQVTNFNCDCDGASGVATDQNDNVWVTNYNGDSISELSSCGVLLLDAATGGGVAHPQGIAIDGAGTAWVANLHGNSISEIAGSSSAVHGTYLSPVSGYGSDAALLNPFAIAVDSSGSIWVTNSGNNTLTQFVGGAVPISTPLAGTPQLP
jgi:streptogramin lyase